MRRLNIKKIILSFTLAIFVLGCVSSKLPKIKAKINKKIYSFEVAATEDTRKDGLMFRKKLNKNSGMLFVYTRKLRLSFYMKNTFIPLDIAFLDEQFKIVDIQQMEPLDETSIVSKKDAQFALEANQGFFDRVGLKVGDKIEFLSAIPYIMEY